MPLSCLSNREVAGARVDVAKLRKFGRYANSSDHDSASSRDDLFQTLRTIAADADMRPFSLQAFGSRQRG